MRLAGPGGGGGGDAIRGAREVARFAPQPTPLPKGVLKDLRLGHGLGEGQVEVAETQSRGTRAPAWLQEGRTPLGHLATPEVRRVGRV